MHTNTAVFIALSAYPFAELSYMAIDMCGGYCVLGSKCLLDGTYVLLIHKLLSFIRRDTVLKVLKELDPDGVESRRSLKRRSLLMIAV